MVIGFSTKLAWIFALLLILVMTTQVRAQPPPGFISIDCGWQNNSSYVDAKLGLKYSSDVGFVEGGQNHEILPEFIDDLENDQQKTLRSFPDGLRNCYTLPSTIGKKYLLRALFTYGNYDGLNKSLDGSLFLFGLHIGVNSWEAVDMSNWGPAWAQWKEVLTVAPGNSVSVCLVNFGLGIPFISSLELRPLLDTMYPFVNTSVSVSLFQRLRFGNITDQVTRYPTDDYDRFWESYSWAVGNYAYPYISLNTTNQVYSLPGNDAFNVPLAIMQNATTIDANYSAFQIMQYGPTNNKDAKTLQLLPIFHFAEINGSNPNRRFDIYTPGEGLFQDFSPSRFQVDSMYKSGLFLQKGDAIFILNKTAGSSLPPLINAFEVYALVLMENLTTDSNDVKYMNEVKAHYNLSRTSWNGDPCSPREYSWEGLTCDYSESNPNPRIVTVNLSGSGLGGGFAISFLKMTLLENLDLSHNNLAGAIPDYNLISLKVLNLSNNKLDGPIPNYILQRVQAGLHEYFLQDKVKSAGDIDSLNWEQRLHIALDAAQGLEYLHELCTPSIVHRDVKTPNILLDKNLVGIISDFGLSRAFNDAHTHISTVVAGTLGYLDPEYHATFQLTVKTDVYSFGIVLLEIITGQPPVLMDPQTAHLPNWVRKKIAKGSIHDVVDKRLLDQYDVSSLENVVDIAMNCVENASIDRPTMTEVVSRLKVWLPAVSSEKQSISGTPRFNKSMDAEIPKQFEMMISGVNNDESTTGGMTDISMFSGR